MRALAPILAVGLSFACGAPTPKDGDDREPIARPIAGGPTSLPPASPRAEPRLELIEGGAEPRRRLRYRPRVGDVYAVEFSMEGELVLSSYGARMLEQSVDSSSSYEIRVSEVGAGGDIGLELTITRYDLPGFGPLPGRTVGGLEGTLTVSDRGVLLSADLPFLEDQPLLDASLELAEFFLVLPAEPIGVGGRWRTERPVMRNGISEVAVESNRIVELDGERVRVIAQLQYVNLPQRIPALSRDPEGYMELTDYSSSGTSEVAIDLGAVIARMVAFSVELDATMSHRKPGNIGEVRMKMTATMRSEGVDRR